ncbi:U11-48K-like CHHC zinc finger containing protein, putative [Angomonas deanei]|uniref:U11-48K-like CHHC zinc finger containing protein, putative n=1 Tax=Angomonas deanei TaxID=59799 RepID=A0A7G2CIA6_9TRYP|nr:U11-48K-like CHHC zinc finger containing protein, putative [Angomonas deanei]
MTDEPKPEKKKKGSIAERMLQLQRRVAEARVAQLGEERASYTICPFDARHVVPLASLVSHVQEEHGGDALSLVGDAMYSQQTGERRTRYLEQMYGDHENGVVPSDKVGGDGDECEKRMKADSSDEEYTV